MEDKADPAATLALHGEQIIRLRERMECLAARVSKTEADVAHRAGTADSLHFGMSYPSRSAQRRTIPEQR